MSRLWNGAAKPDTRRKVVFTPELLYEIGASGKSLRVIAEELGCCQQLISRHINKSYTNRTAYDKGREKLKTL